MQLWLDNPERACELLHCLAPEARAVVLLGMDLCDAMRIVTAMADDEVDFGPSMPFLVSFKVALKPHCKDYPHCRCMVSCIISAFHIRSPYKSQVV